MSYVHSVLLLETHRLVWGQKNWRGGSGLPDGTWPRTSTHTLCLCPVVCWMAPRWIPGPWWVSWAGDCAVRPPRTWEIETTNSLYLPPALLKGMWQYIRAKYLRNVTKTGKLRLLKTWCLWDRCSRGQLVHWGRLRRDHWDWWPAQMTDWPTGLPDSPDWGRQRHMSDTVWERKPAWFIICPFTYNGL